jgi:hypothetical protein
MKSTLPETTNLLNLYKEQKVREIHYCRLKYIRHFTAYLTYESFQLLIQGYFFFFFLSRINVKNIFFPQGGVNDVVLSF